MPYFIRQVKVPTWLKFLVEAENKQDVDNHRYDEEYLGYVDIYEAEDRIISGPFATKNEALDSDEAWVDDE